MLEDIVVGSWFVLRSMWKKKKGYEGYCEREREKQERGSSHEMNVRQTSKGFVHIQRKGRLDSVSSHMIQPSLSPWVSRQYRCISKY